MDMEFSSLTDLYNKLLPVLKTKVNEMKLRKITYISEKDIWNYQTKKWSKSVNLIFSDMVNDILNTSNDDYENYIKSIWKEKRDTLS